MKLGPRSSEPGGGSAADSPAPTVPGAPGNQPQRQSAQNIALPNKATLWHPIVLQVSPLGTAHRTAAALTRRNAANRSIAMASVIIRARSDEIVFLDSESVNQGFPKWSISQIRDQISCVLHHQLNGKNPSRYLRGSRPLKGTAPGRAPAGYTPAKWGTRPEGGQKEPTAR